MRLALPLAVRLTPLLAAALLVAGCEGEISDIPAALKVVKSQPANGELAVSPDVVLRVEFDDEVDPLSLTSTTFALQPAAAGGLAAEGRFLTYTPYNPLALDTQYLVEVASSVRGKKGGKLGGKHGFRFTTRGTNSDILPPAPVMDLAATVKTGTSVELAWSATGDDGDTGTATRYDLRWSSAAGCPIKPENFDAATAIPLPSPGPAGADESTTVPNLPRKAFVCFAIKAVDDSGNSSGLSNVVTLTLPDLVPPNAPVVRLVNAGETAAELGWKAVGDDADEGLASDYTLYRQAASPCDVLTPTTALLDGGTATAIELPFPGPAGSDESYAAASLTRDTDYCFLLRVRDVAGNASWSNVLPVHTPDLTPPARPVLAVTVAMPTALVLEWTAVGDDGMAGSVTREELEVAEGPCPSSAAAFVPTQTLVSSPVEGGGGSALTVQGLKPDLDHCFRLLVADNAGAVVTSNLAQGHTQDIVAPGAPELVISNVGNTGADLSWTTGGDNDGAGQALEEELRMARGPACDVLAPGTFAQGDLVLQQSPPPAGTPQTTSLGGLTADEDHCVLLRVKDEAGLSSYSQLVRFKTLDLVPPAEPQLFVLDGGVGADRVALEWLAVGDNGVSGQAAAQSLRYAAGTGCTAFGTDAGGPGTAMTLLAPLPPQSAEFAEVFGLDEDTLHCFQLSVADEVGNGVRSAVVLATTRDETPPAAPVLVAKTLPTGVAYQWLAVCENRGNAACGTPGYGTASSYQFVHRMAAPNGSCPVVPAGQGQQVMLRGSCGSGCGAGTVCAAVGNEAPTCKPVSTACGSGCGERHQACVNPGTGATCALKLLTQPVDMAAPGTPQEVKVEGLPDGSTWCAQVMVADEAGNSAFSNEAKNDRPIGAEDLTPPAAVNNLRVTLARGIDTVDLAWTAPGDDANTGTATSYAAFMATGADCVAPGQGDPFAANAGTVQPVLLTSTTPQAAGASEKDRTSVQNIDTLGAAACFRLRATDEAGNASALSNLAFPPRPIADLVATTGVTGNVELEWTASGAHDEEGMAASYTLHVRTVPVGNVVSCPNNGPEVLALTSGLSPTLNATGPLASGSAETGNFSGITPGTSLCVVLEAFNLYGDSALSNVAALTLADTVPPADFTLALAGKSPTSASFSFTLTGDDGANGTPAEYELGVVEALGTVAPGTDPCTCDPNSGVSCDLDQGEACLGSQCVAFFAAAQEVQPTGAFDLQSLDPDTHYCVWMRALDDAEPPNAGHSNLEPLKPPRPLHVQTDPAGSGGDVDPPTKPVLAALQPGDVRSTSSSVPEADLSWTAVAEDSADASSAAVTNYAAVYRATKAGGSGAVTGQADCDALDALGAAAAVGMPSESLSVGSPTVGDALTATASFTNASPEQPLCVALRATDAANNAALSSWMYVRDNTAPGELLNFKVTAIGRNSVTLTVDAPGDDVLEGQATAYQLRVQAGACPANESDFDTSLIPVPGTPAPGTPTFADTLTATGLSAGTTYCLHLVAVDDVGLPSPAEMTEVSLPVAAAFDLQAVRDAVNGSPTRSISGDPSLAASGVTVTYLKPDLSSGRAGAQELDKLPGFFVQGSGNGPAVYVQRDPATAVQGGLKVGDRVDLTDVYAELMLPGGSRDPGGSGGVVVITEPTTVTKLAACTPPAQGQADPCAPGFACSQDGHCLLPVLTLQDLGGVASAQFEQSEHEYLEVALTITGPGSADAGFVTFTAQTATPESLPLKVTDTVASANQLKAGMTLTVRAPLWRQGTEYQLAAWNAEDLVEVPPAFTLTSPVEGSVDVPLNHAPITLVMNRAPPVGALANASSIASGPCGGGDMVELSANGFQDCVGVSVSVTAGHGTDERYLSLVPVQPLAPGRRYQVRLPTALTGGANLVESRLGFVTVPADTCTPRQLVISQVLTANAGNFTNDFVELHNRSGEPYDFSAAGNKLELATSGDNGATWTFIPLSRANLGLTLPGGGYFTLSLTEQEDLPATGALVALVLPDADGDGTSNAQEVLDGTDPFDADPTAQMGAGCPGDTTSLDRVAIGAAPTCFGAGAPAPVPLAGQSLQRRVSGCIDTGDNAADFDALSALDGRQPGGPVATCYCTGDAAPNLTDTDAGSGSAPFGGEADACIVYDPQEVTASLQSNASLTVYGRLSEQGLTVSTSTEHPTAPRAVVRAEFGMAVPGTPLAAWTFRPASAFNVSGADYDEYLTTVTLPNQPGTTLRYLYRFSLDDGQHWTYCDTNGTGSDNGLSFDFSQPAASGGPGAVHIVQ